MPRGGEHVAESDVIYIMASGVFFFRILRDFNLHYYRFSSRFELRYGRGNEVNISVL